MKDFISKEFGDRVGQYIEKHVDVESKAVIIISTTTPFNIQYHPQDENYAIVNLHKINDIRYINKFFETVNSKLCTGGVFIGCVETKELRKHRLLKKYPKGFNYIYYFFDFILKRVFPKFGLTKHLYFFLTRGFNRVLSRAETLGRLYSCGFDVIDEENIDGQFYFVARKVGHPVFDSNPTYGPLIKLKRIGKGGKIIRVYKFRTMHPFAEYLQDYIYKKNKLDEGGKFKDDFRISGFGKFLRAFWFDELPMLINFIKGDLKIVGVRPISQHYFNLYTPELQEKRKKVKPGLIPPFYADMPKTLDEIMQSEINYIDRYLKNPISTDISYFFRAMNNILIKRARSK